MQSCTAIRTCDEHTGCVSAFAFRNLFASFSGDPGCYDFFDAIPEMSCVLTTPLCSPTTARSDLICISLVFELSPARRVFRLAVSGQELICWYSQVCSYGRALRHIRPHLAVASTALATLCASETLVSYQCSCSMIDRLDFSASFNNEACINSDTLKSNV